MPEKQRLRTDRHKRVVNNFLEDECRNFQNKKLGG
jgi:hypothetical protein